MNHECDVVREGFPDLLFGGAEGGAPSERVALLEEVARCEACAREYRTMAETLQVFDLAAAAALPAEEFWPGYEERLRRRMAQEIRPNFWAHRAGFGVEYKLTFVEDEGLTRRLAREVKAVAHDAELTWPEFKRDPEDLAHRAAESGRGTRGGGGGVGRALKRGLYARAAGAMCTPQSLACDVTRERRG